MIDLDINGRAHAIDADPNTPLLYMLRDDRALCGTKFGCGLGQCGACTVLVGSGASPLLDNRALAPTGKPCFRSPRF